MLRFDQCVCGTTTTGTGTLTLAATPGPPGGIDPDVWARAVGFGNSVAVLIDYTIVEYTDATFATAKSAESGIGTLTLGGSSGVANCTLARTTIFYSATNLNSQPATATSYGTAISIGTAANVLVMISPQVNLMGPAISYSAAGATTLSRDGLGCISGAFVSSSAALTLISSRLYFYPYLLLTPLNVSKARVRVGGGGSYTGQNNNVYAALYDINTSGMPGKLLADFGVLGTANQSLATAGSIIASAALGTSLRLMPGMYYMAAQAIWTAGGTGTPAVSGTTTVGSSSAITAQLMGTAGGAGITCFYLTGGTPAFADPAATPTTADASSVSVPLVGLGS